VNELIVGVDRWGACLGRRDGTAKPPPPPAVRPSVRPCHISVSISSDDLSVAHTCDNFVDDPSISSGRFWIGSNKIKLISLFFPRVDDEINGMEWECLFRSACVN
jgi:hypothetical protein